MSRTSPARGSCSRTSPRCWRRRRVRRRRDTPPGLARRAPDAVAASGAWLHPRRGAGASSAAASCRCASPASCRGRPCSGGSIAAATGWNSMPTRCPRARGCWWSTTCWPPAPPRGGRAAAPPGARVCGAGAGRTVCARPRPLGRPGPAARRAGALNPCASARATAAIGKHHPVRSPCRRGARRRMSPGATQGASAFTHGARCALIPHRSDRPRRRSPSPSRWPRCAGLGLDLPRHPLRA